MAKAKTSIVLADQHKEWLQSQGSISESIARLINQEVLRLDAIGRERDAQLEKMTRKERFLHWVGECFHIRRATKSAAATERDVEKWMEEDGFTDQVVSRQQEFLEDLELLIVDCARGVRHIDKSAMTGLIAFLNNHAPNWGRLKAELLGRIFGPVFDGLLKIVKSKVPAPTYKEIAEEFTSYRELAFSEFSE